MSRPLEHDLFKTKIMKTKTVKMYLTYIGDGNTSLFPSDEAESIPDMKLES